MTLKFEYEGGLSKTEVAIIEKYWEIDSEEGEEGLKWRLKVKEIAETHDTSINKISQLVKKHSSAIVEGYFDCGHDFEMATRSSSPRLGSKICADCLEAQREEERLEEERDRKLVIDHIKCVIGEWVPNRPAPEIEDLGFTECLHIYALVRGSQSQSAMSKISPLVLWPVPFSPSKKYALEVVESLLKSGLIELDVGSQRCSEAVDVYRQREAFDGENSSDRDHIRGLLDAFCWRVTLEGFDEDSVHYLRSRLTEKGRRYGPSLSAWKKVAVMECIELLIYYLDQYNLPLQSEKKADSILNSLLEYRTPAQLHALIRSRVRSAAGEIRNPNLKIFRSNAAGYAINNIEGLSDFLLRKGDSPYDSHRNPQLPQSILSAVVSNVVLRMDGFKENPFVEGWPSVR